MRIKFLIFKRGILDKSDEMNGEKKIEKMAPPPLTIPMSVLLNPRYCKNMAIYP